MTEADSDWAPLSVRTGIRPAIELHHGLPKHLHAPVRHWLEGEFGYRTRPRGGASGMNQHLILHVATRAHVSLSNTHHPSKLMQQLLAAGEADENLYLDILDATLASARTRHAALESILEAGRSVWRVADDGRALQERVDGPTRMAIELASSPLDVASEELAEAWSNIVGREPDASDAWDHAIKAVEAVLIPIVVPRQDKAQLGHVLGTLDRQGHLFTLSIGNSDGVKTVVAMLRLLWPNPDRHASPNERRRPTDQEARAVVHLAVTLVQWVREGLLERVA